MGGSNGLLAEIILNETNDLKWKIIEPNPNCELENTYKNRLTIKKGYIEESVKN